MVKKKKKPRFKGKDKNMVRHFQNRTRERYGLVLSYQDVANIVKMIKSGKSEYIKSKSNMHTRHKVFYRGQELVVGYDKRRDILVTAIPMRNNGKRIRNTT